MTEPIMIWLNTSTKPGAVDGSMTGQLCKG